MKIFWIILLSIASGACYRIGGWEKGEKLVRRLCVPVVASLALLALGFKPHWAWIVHFIALYGALSTYHDYLAPDGSSENWICWLFTGVFYGLAALPLLFCGVSVYHMIIRAAVLGVTTMIWSTWIKRDWIEEMGRGALIIATLVLL